MKYPTRSSRMVALALLSLATAAYGDAGWRHYPELTVDVIADDGSPFQQYPVTRGRHGHRSQRAYLEAERGEQYAIRVRNDSDRRIGLVIAVDGRNIISGARSNLTSDERMYVLNPGQSNVYRGWRTGKNRVNRFYFTEPSDSYADAFGDRSAMGVIAVAAFRERPREPYALEPDKGAPSGPQHGAGNYRRQAPSALSDQAGTGFGDRTWSPSRRVRFEPEDRPWRELFLKYEWHRTLCDLGVIGCRPTYPNNRFWPQPPNDGYAPPPPGYRPW